MTRLGWLVVLGISALIILACGLLLWLHGRAYTPVQSNVATSTSEVLDPSALSIYTSGEYGFTFFYPANAIVHDSFSTTSVGNAPWRVGATAPGTAVVDISLSSTTPQGMVRVGLSKNSKEVSVCIKVGAAEQAQPNLLVGSTTWSVFAFDKVGTDDEEHITSYRVIRNNTCYALETFQPFTATTTTPFTPTDIVKSFTFAT